MIRINGQEVLTDSKVGVKYALVNPHLLYDTIPSSTAEIPTFPAVRQNRGVFDYYEEPQAGNYLPELLYQHFHNGELIREGYFLLTEASLDTGYKGAYSDRLGLFFGDYQSKNLREIDFGTVTPVLPLSPVNSVAGETAYCYPTILNDFYYGANAAAASYTGRVNDYASGSYKVSPKTPMFFASWVLKRIAAITGVTITGSFFTHPVWSKLILFNTSEAETATFSVANHLPALSVVEFILELRKVANLKFDFNSVAKTLTIDFWDECLRTPTNADWTGCATIGETKTPEPNTRLQIAMQMDGNDGLTKDKPALLADYISPEVAGNRNGIATVAIKFSTLLTDQATGLPMCRQEGLTSKYGQDAKPFTPRLLFWAGMSAGMPVASHTLNGITLTPAGLAATVWKETIALRTRMFYLAKKFILNEADLAKLDFSKKFHCEGVDYIVAQVNASVPVKGVAECLLIGGV
ncbi:hypothetical protein GCM10010967_12020 [Dyadobacter beijingensis]|uniref:Uncharacterized protein n=1 Tax=Dyadobacter beijingensis TaxID=365489 RepID=A0ABQ2HL76_9BACT|nr:hypothetical protein [Dyadobacter beijingensis]GGM81849.1 hypothetical protein GCM10010967_12020 [Dyadobacter beijingensis]